MNNNQRPIICGTDFSVHAAEAASVAAAVATEVEVAEHRDVAKAICQEAERFSANVICLGSHGRSGLSKAVLGSMAQKVMKQSSRPLLGVRSPKR